MVPVCRNVLNGIPYGNTISIITIYISDDITQTYNKCLTKLLLEIFTCFRSDWQYINLLLYNVAIVNIDFNVLS